MKKLGLVLLASIVIYFIFIIRQDIINNSRLKQEICRTTKKIQEEKARAHKLQKRLKALKTNQYIEKLARTRLGLIRKGETAYKVIMTND